MKKIFFIFAFVSILFGAPHSIITRDIGSVTEVKLLGITESDDVLCLIRTDRNTYVIKNRHDMPFIYVSDTLIEYWINYRRNSVGTKSGNRIYEILNYDVR